MVAASLAAVVPQAIAGGSSEVKAPTLDCTLGFDGLRAMATSLPGAQTGQWGEFDIVHQEVPDVWRIEIAFTPPSHPAHPAVVIRTLRKQVTEVWTADSRGCGYGNKNAFTALMADMKAGDTAMTEESRRKVDEEKGGQSPLSHGP